MPVLNNLLLKHLKTMAKKMPLNMQHELFRTILLPNFRGMFPTGIVKTTVDVQLSLSEDVSIVNSYLDLLYICMTTNDDLAVLFHRYEGCDALHHLALIDDYDTSSKAVTILEYLCHLNTQSDNSQMSHGTNSNNSKQKFKTRNIDESFHASLKDISNKAISTLVHVASTQLNNNLEKNFESLFCEEKSCLLDVLNVILELLHEHESSEEDFMDPTVNLRCEKLLGHLIDEITTKIKSHEESEEDDDKLANTNCWFKENYLIWLKVLLPVQLIKCSVCLLV